MNPELEKTILSMTPLQVALLALRETDQLWFSYLAGVFAQSIMIEDRDFAVGVSSLMIHDDYFGARLALARWVDMKTNPPAARPPGPPPDSSNDC